MRVYFSPLVGNLEGADKYWVMKPIPGHPGWYEFYPRTPHAPKPGAPDEECACWAFKFCDEIYSNMSALDQDLWHRGLKKRKMSGYGLWMSECLTLVNLGLNPPDRPSVSGGFDPHAAEEGDRYPLPEGNPCQPPPPPPPPPGRPCMFCDDETPEFYQVHVQDIIGPPSVFNGVFVLTQDDTAHCMWRVITLRAEYILEKLADDFFQFTIEGIDPFGNMIFDTNVAPPDCYDSCTVFFAGCPPPWLPQPGAKADLIPWAI